MGVFFFKQKTAYELRISAWSSDVCASDLRSPLRSGAQAQARLTADQSEALRSVLRVFCGGDPIAVANAAVRLIESLLPAAPWPRRHAGTIRSARRPRLYRVRARRCRRHQ